MNYVTDDTMNAYLRTVQPMYDGVLGEIQREAIAAEVPIIPLETARLLSVLLTMQKPKHILEIGTAVGFSAGLMCRYLPEDGTVTTIDRFEVMLKDARVNIKRMGLEDKIKILEGDAANILPTLEGPYDVIFLDLYNGLYLDVMEGCIRLLKKGGILIADDTLFPVTKNKAFFLESNKKMDEFNKKLSERKDMDSILLPFDDGITLAVKI